MEVYPAIDILDGKVVRLFQGSYKVPTVYGDSPVEFAKTFAEAGANWIHVVDLDAARGKESPGLNVLKNISSSVDIKIQFGGGVRSIKAAADRFEAGADRVVVGTVAVTNQNLCSSMLNRFPGRIAIGLDAYGNTVAIEGWQNQSGTNLLSLARYFDCPEVGAIIVTDIEKNGTLSGPAFEQLKAVLGQVSVPVIASGGVSSLRDLHDLAELESKNRKLSGVIVGKALYENKLSLRDALSI